jgi:hypothetical protein
VFGGMAMRMPSESPEGPTSTLNGAAMLLLRSVNDPCTASSRFTSTHHTVFPRFSTVSTTNRIRDVTVSPRLFLGFPRTFHDLP